MALGEKIKGITIEFGGDTTKLDDALKDIKKSTKQVNSSLRDIDRALKFNPGNTELLTQKQRELGQKVENTTKKLNALKAAEEEAAKAFQKGDISQGEFDALRRDIVQTESDLRHFRGEYEKLGSVRLTTLSQTLDNVGTKVETVGHKLVPLSTAFLGIGVAAGKASIDFESAFAGVTKTVDGTPEQLERIRQGILNLSKETSSSAGQIAAVAEAAGQLGIKTDDIMSFTEVMIKLGDTTNLSAEEAASALAKYANITGLAAEDYGRLGSVIVDLGNNFATTEANIVDFAMRIAGSAKQVGFTDTQIMALSASLSSVGLEADAGGSAISKVITQIDKDVALNSDTLATWAHTAGMSIADFAASWKQDAYGALQKVVSGMGDAKAGGENLNVLLDELGITNIRTSDTMKRLSSASELMSDATNKANTAWTENNALNNEAQKRYETTAAQLEQLKAALVEMGVDLGQEFLPQLKEIVSDIKDLTQKFKDLSPEAKKAAVKIIEIGAVAAPALIGVGKLTQGLGSLAKAGSKLTGAFKLKGIIGEGEQFTSILASANLAGFAFTGTFAAVAYAIYAFEQKMHAARNEVEAMNAAQERIVEKIEYTDKITEIYADKLDALIGVEDKSASQKQLMQTYVDQLNSSVEGLNLTYDAENDKLYNNTGQVITNTEAIRAQSEELKKRALAEAYGKNAAEAIEKYVEFTDKATEAEKERGKVAEKMNKLLEIKRPLTETETVQLSALAAEYESIGVDIDSYNAGMLAALKTSQKWNNMVEIQAGALDALKESANAAGLEIPKSLEEGIKDGSYTIPATMEELQALITFDTAIKTAAENGVKIPDTLQAGILSGETTVEEATAQLNGLIAGKVGELPDAFNDAGNAATQSMTDAMDGNKDAVAGKAAEVTSGASLAAYIAAQQSSSAGSAFAASMSQGISNNGGAVASAAWSLAMRGRDNAAGVSFYGTGYNAGSGFANGLYATLDLVGGVASALAGHALHTAQRRLNVHSPSKEFEKIGIFGGEGLAIGFKKTTPDVDLALTNLADSALSAVKRRINDSEAIQIQLSGIAATRTAGSVITASQNAQTRHQSHNDAIDAQLYSLLNMLISAIKDDHVNKKNEMKIIINAAPGQDVDSIAEAVRQKIENREMSKLRSRGV